MKKIIFICLTLMLITQGLSSQLIKDPHKTYIPKVIPSSPLSQIFEQYVTHPVTEYSGLPQIEIPLYEISMKGMTIPITLSYHAGGIKHKQYPGEVGLGWSIGSTGYRITRTVNNKPDEISHHVDISYIENIPYSSESNDANRGSYLVGLTRYTAYEGGSYTSRVKSRRDDVDGEYDLFTYLAPTTSSKFILDVTTDRFSNNPLVELANLDDNLDKISINGVDMLKDKRQNITIPLNTFKIMDDRGNQFYFGSQDDRFVEKSTEVNNVINGSYAKVTTAWVMEKAITPFNDIVNFTYDEYSLEDSRPGTSRKVMIYDALYYSYNTSGSGDEKQPPQGPYLDSDISPSISHWVKMVKTISTDHETITIERETSGEERGRIKQIVVKSNANNSQIRKVVFNYENGYDYLLSNIIIYGSDNTNRKVYNFEYYGRDLIDSYYPDHWGYNTSTSKYNGFHSEFSSDQYVYAWYSDNPTIFKSSSSYNGYFNTNRKDNRIPDRLSLKKIKYPTGGFTEYIYEKHRYYDNIELKEIEGGGLRIKKIISEPNDGSEPIATEFQYSCGIPTFSINYKDFADEHYILTSEYSGYNEASYRLLVKRIYSTTPTGDLSWGLFSVNYPQVTKLEYKIDSQTGNLIKYNGKTISEYSINSNFYGIGFMQPGTGAVRPYFSNIQHPFPRYIEKYNLSEKPMILKRTYLDNDDRALKREEYYYEKTKYNKTFKGLKINQRMFCYGEHRYTYYFPEELERMLDQNPQQYGGMRGYIDPYATIRMDFFDYGSYEYKIQQKLLYRKVTSTYSTPGTYPSSTNEGYIYNSRNQLVEKSLSMVGDYDLVEMYSYPLSNTELARRNMYSTVIHKQLAESNNGSVIHNEYYNYPDNSIFPNYVEGLNSRKELTYDKYDERGNLLQYTRLDGVTVSYIWSYNYKYPIAEIVNASYDKVSTALAMNMVTLATNKNPDESIIAKVKALKEHNTLKEALVTVYTYKPLVGILTATDSRGVITHYEYDDFGRLKATYLEENGVRRKLQDYNYNYVNK